MSSSALHGKGEPCECEGGNSVHPSVLVGGSLLRALMGVIVGCLLDNMWLGTIESVNPIQCTRCVHLLLNDVCLPLQARLLFRCITLEYGYLRRLTMSQGADITTRKPCRSAISPFPASLRLPFFKKRPFTLYPVPST